MANQSDNEEFIIEKGIQENEIIGSISSPPSSPGSIASKTVDEDRNNNTGLNTPPSPSSSESSARSASFRKLRFDEESIASGVVTPGTTYNESLAEKPCDSRSSGDVPTTATISTSGIDELLKSGTKNTVEFLKETVESWEGSSSHFAGMEVLWLDVGDKLKTLASWYLKVGLERPYLTAFSTIQIAFAAIPVSIFAIVITSVAIGVLFFAIGMIVFVFAFGLAVLSGVLCTTAMAGLMAWIFVASTIFTVQIALGVAELPAVGNNKS
ncbi:hypothetical protein V1514DRAFT_320637 [Lipomyces japonicus]|uniref:uncharacterized protein n=1 Tax=Lipomyces japonicus TaxID=56871 RepID=UPI0034CEA43D